MPDTGHDHADNLVREYGLCRGCNKDWEFHFAWLKDQNNAG